MSFVCFKSCCSTQCILAFYGTFQLRSLIVTSFKICCFMLENNSKFLDPYHDVNKYDKYLWLPLISGLKICSAAGANNLIPIEIALKIANKIYANERFSAYIVIPMWPEGNPTGAPTQRILYWQVRASL